MIKPFNVDLQCHTDLAAYSSACVQEPDRPWGTALLKAGRCREKTRARGAREKHRCAPLLLI